MCSIHYHRQRAYRISRNPLHWAVVHARRLCVIADCGRPHCIRGLCNAHYLKAKREGFLHQYPKVRPRRRAQCSVAGCEQDHADHGLCSMHRNRARRRGTLDQYSWDDSTSEEPESVWRQRCSEPGCEGRHIARGLCTKHYQRAQRDGTLSQYSLANQSGPKSAPKRKKERRSQFCSVIGCKSSSNALGLCKKHLADEMNLRKLATLRPEGTPVQACLVPGCDTLQFDHGLCRKHFGRLRTAELLDDWDDMKDTILREGTK